MDCFGSRVILARSSGSALGSVALKEGNLEVLGHHRSQEAAAFTSLSAPKL
jgi:hypothetical protein